MAREEVAALEIPSVPPSPKIAQESPKGPLTPVLPKSNLKPPATLVDREIRLMRGCVDMFGIPEESAKTLFEKEDPVLKIMATYRQRHSMEAMRRPDHIELPRLLQDHVTLSDKVVEWCPANKKQANLNKIDTIASTSILQMLKEAKQSGTVWPTPPTTGMPTLNRSRGKLAFGDSFNSTKGSSHHAITVQLLHRLDTERVQASHVALERLRGRDPKLFETGSDMGNSDTEENKEISFVTEEERRKRKVDQGILVRSLLWDTRPQDDDDNPKVDERRLKAIAKKAMRRTGSPRQTQEGLLDLEGDPDGIKLRMKHLFQKKEVLPAASMARKVPLLSVVPEPM